MVQIVQHCRWSRGCQVQTFWKGEAQAPYPSFAILARAPNVAGMAQHRYRQERRGDASLLRASVLHFWHAIRCRLAALGNGGQAIHVAAPGQQRPWPPVPWPALTHFPVPESAPPFQVLLGPGWWCSYPKCE